MSTNNLPIGILDSGIGGLSVLKAINSILPHEAFIYIADNGNLPYGEKTFDQIATYTEKNLDFLLKKKCKSIVVACHTASIAIQDVLDNNYEKREMIFGMVDPLVKDFELAGVNKDAKIGIIATKKTIESGVYQKRINALGFKNNIEAISAPDLVTLTEEIYHNNADETAVFNKIKKYWDTLNLNNTEVLILACTHYIHLKDYLNNLYNGNIIILDGTYTLSVNVKKFLTENKLLNTGKKFKNNFIASSNNYNMDKLNKLI